MRILIATDAWEPQVNGVVRTYQRVNEELVKLGHKVSFVTPNDYYTFPCPTYPEIRLALVSSFQLKKLVDQFQPDVVHVATEGPIGWAMRRACLSRNIPFTTAYHTRFPEYVVERFPLPLSMMYKIVKRFHNVGGGTMVATQSLANELSDRGFVDLLKWTRGVNTDLFKPRSCRLFGNEKVALYVGRVAPEKNIESFLDLEFEGQKVVVGDGPSLANLKAKYKDVIFTGKKTGQDLAECYSSVDVFVFPSLTDTFGIVMLEAMASGVPIAAFRVTGPIDVVEEGVTGALSDDNLGDAVAKALSLDRDVCRQQALNFSWEHCAQLFLENLTIATYKNQQSAA